MNLEELKNQSREVTKPNHEDNDNTDDVVIVEDDSSDLEDQIDDIETMGLVINNNDLKNSTDSRMEGMQNNPHKKIAENTTKAIQDIDTQIQEQANLFKQAIDQKKFSSDEEKITEVKILIDKTKLGEIEFTEEELKKIESAKTIRLVEVEEKELYTIKIKKPKNKKNKKIIERVADKSLSPVMAIASGYLGKMGNCSANEIVSMTQQTRSNVAETHIEQWQVIYNKLKYTSIGKFDDFDDFLRNTAFMDFDNFVYSALCATYPDNDELRLLCGNKDKCGRPFVYKYSNKMLIRTDLITERTYNVANEILTASTFLDNAKKYHKNSLLNTIKRIALSNDVIVDICISSAYDMIYKIYKKIEDRYREKPNYASSITAASMVKQILVKDEDDEWEPVDDPEELIELIYLLGDEETAILLTVIADFIKGYQYIYGLNNIVCDHCGYVHREMEVDVKELFFQRSQDRLSTKLELKDI